MMTSAEYGHMEKGRCIDIVDPRYRGCSDDVLPIFDKWCSGKHECTFNTVDDELKNIYINCPKFIVRYAKIQYTCIKGNASRYTIIMQD